MAAFNLKETIDAVVDGVTVWDSEIAFRLRAPAWVTVKNAVVHHVTYGVRYEDNIPQLRVWNTTFGAGVTQPFLAASSSSTGLQVANVLVLASSLPPEASGGSSRAVSASAFVNAAANDYHLAPGSLVIDAGASLIDVRTDREGTPRPQGAYYDVGAYEYCGTSCGGSSPPPPPPCSYSITPSARSVTAAGGMGTVTVTTGASCGWNVSNAPSWVTVAATTGTGGGSVTYSVAANTSTSPRTANLTIAAQAFVITQEGASPSNPPPPAPAPTPAPSGCDYALAPGEMRIPAPGGTFDVTVSVTGGDSCRWTTTNVPGWVTVVRGTGLGSGEARFSVAPNKTARQRSAVVLIAGRSFELVQLGAQTR
jgi:hypothetical protein